MSSPTFTSQGAANKRTRLKRSVAMTSAARSYGVTHRFVRWY
jgi:hypothetical protein